MNIIFLEKERLVGKESDDFKKILGGYGLLTAHIYYRMPDFMSLIQEFVWQTNDLAPQFPELRKFLNFWNKKIEGPITSVQITHSLLIKPATFRAIKGEIVFH